MIVPQRRTGAALAALAVIVFVLVGASALQTRFPIVLSDEANYLLPSLHGYSASNFERWSILSAIPNHVFYTIYGTLARQDPYTSAKVLNAALVAATAFPMYAVARMHLPAGQALPLAALGALAPTTSYARYYMPESLYFLGFWVSMLALLRTLPRSVPMAGFVAGAALGTLSLVKPHALGLAAGVMAYFLLRHGSLLKRFVAVLLVAGTYAAIRALLSFALNGRVDTTLAGPAYATMLEGGFAAWPAMRNAIGHLAALTILVGLPLLAVARHVGGALVRRSRADDLALLSLCVLVALVVMTVVFSSSVYAIAPTGERITRLHGRYYGFTLPLLIMAFARVSPDTPAWRGGRWRVLASATLVLSAAGIIAMGYEASFVDNPDMSLLTRWPEALLVLGVAVGCCTLAVWRVRMQDAAVRVVPIVWWGAIAVVTSLALLAAPYMGRAFKPNAVDHALATQQLQALVGRDDVMVVGSHHEPTEPFRVMFHLASHARGRLTDAGTTLAPEQIPNDIGVLVLLPQVTFAGTAEISKVGPVTLVRMR